MAERNKHMLIKKFIQVFRGPKMRGIIFAMPMLQVLVFGYAVTLDARNVPTAVYDLGNSVASSELVAWFQKSGYFDIVGHIDSEERTRELFDRGEASAVLQMNWGFGDALRAGRIAELRLIVDATDSNTAGVVLDYSAKITKELSRKVLTRRFTRVEGSFEKPGRVELRPAPGSTTIWKAGISTFRA